VFGRIMFATELLLLLLLLLLPHRLQAIQVTDMT
jgi:hypothetical protein